jgi:hypothetical protein
MTGKMKVWYQSTMRGKASDKDDLLCFGKVRRIPRADFGYPSMLKWEPDPGDLLTDMEAVDGSRTLEPVPGAFMERYEVIDQGTGDVWVMWRIPYQKKAGTE